MRRLGFLCLLLLPVLGWAESSAVYQHSVQRPLAAVYDGIYQSLESRKLWVVFEANIGANLAGMAERLGDDYNRNQLEGIRTLVVCNAFYANRVSNLDSTMLALCPLRVTVIHKAGRSTALFVRPTHTAQGSPAEPVLREIETLVVAAIEEGAAKP